MTKKSTEQSQYSSRDAQINNTCAAKSQCKGRKPCTWEQWFLVCWL